MSIKFFFTGDNHFFHNNIITLAKRPFSSLEAMHEAMIDGWNEVVGKNDVVYHLGDFTFEGAEYADRIFKQLNGIIKILSNTDHHDRRWLPENYFGLTDYESKSGWTVEVVPPLLHRRFPELSIGRGVLSIVMCHFPLAVWEGKHYDSIHLHAHSHGRFPHNYELSMDVGVDCTNYKPIELQTVMDIMREKKINKDTYLQERKERSLEGEVTDGCS